VVAEHAPDVRIVFARQSKETVGLIAAFSRAVGDIARNDERISPALKKKALKVALRAASDNGLTVRPVQSFDVQIRQIRDFQFLLLLVRLKGGTGRPRAAHPFPLFRFQISNVLIS
jgi:hypothetical protein